MVQADESRLSQVFENIYDNAIEHAGTGSQQDATGTEQNELTITVGDLSDGFFIEDTGSGIPPSEREDVFEAGHSTEPNGTGLGLYIVREIVDAHRWKIAVTDGSDGGARFEITGVRTT